MKTLHKIIIGDSRQMKEVLKIFGTLSHGRSGRYREKTETIVLELPKGSGRGPMNS